MTEHHNHHHEENHDPRLYGPGFAAVGEPGVRYVLVTPDMLQAIEGAPGASGASPGARLEGEGEVVANDPGHMPNAIVVHPNDRPIQVTSTTTTTMPPQNFPSNGISAEHQALGLVPVTSPQDSQNGQNQLASPVSDKFVAHLEHHPEHPAVEPAKPSMEIRRASIIQMEETPYLVNPLSRLRHAYKEYFGEFIGTMILIIFGNGVNCQVVLSELKQGSYLSISFGWGIGVMFGVHIAGGISGAHINPAVTLALAVWRGFPWRKVPGYMLAQVLGACIGSCLVMGNYHNLLNQFEGGYNTRTYGLPTSSATLFFTDSQPYMSNIGSFFSELFATAVLLACIFCLGDKDNNPAPAGMNGMILLWLIVGIGAALGTQTAYCLNPARDLGPRIAAAMYGYPARIWTYKNCYWIYTPIIATLCGGVVGGFFYDLFLYQGKDSPLNRPWGKKQKKNDFDGELALPQHSFDEKSRS